MLHVNNKGADQPAHPRRLMSATVIVSLKNRLTKPARCKISPFQCSLVGWYNSDLIGNSKDRFSCIEAHMSLSSRFPTKRDSSQSPQLLRLARKMKFPSNKVMYDSFQKGNSKGADQSARMRWLGCAFVVRQITQLLIGKTQVNRAVTDHSVLD